MAKITFYLEGNPVVFEGDVEEVARFLKRVQNDYINLATAETSKAKNAEVIKERAEVERAKRNLPSVEQVKDFILSQPEYSHTTFDVQTHFFGRTFKARGISEGLFHDFLRLATEARLQIEREKNGGFESELMLGRHKIYRWRSNSKR